MTDRLPILAALICRAHSEACSALRQSRAKAIEAGERLAEVKELLPHGDWLPWLRKNCPGITERTAQRYMHLARRKNDPPKNDTVTDLPVVVQPRSDSETNAASCLQMAAEAFEWAGVIAELPEIDGELAQAIRQTARAWGKLAARGEGYPGKRPAWWHGPRSGRTRSDIAKFGYFRDARGAYDYCLRSQYTGQWVKDGTVEFYICQVTPKFKLLGGPA